MTLTAPPPVTRRSHRRGGNRLGPDHPYRHWAPSYERRRALGRSPERHDRNQRTRTIRAIAMAQEQGVLSQVLAAALLALCEMADATMAPIFPKLSTIARKVLGTDNYTNPDGDPGDNPGDASTGGERTAGRWMHDLKGLGWLQWQNRSISNHGQAQGTSNLWRIIIPDDLRRILLDQEDAARSRTNTAKTRPTPKAPQNRPPVDHSEQTGRAARGSQRLNDLRRNHPCPAGCTNGWVDPPDGGPVVRCEHCAGTGHAADLAPP